MKSDGGKQRKHQKVGKESANKRQTPKGRAISLKFQPKSATKKLGRESPEVPTLDPSENKSGLERGDARQR